MMGGQVRNAEAQRIAEYGTQIFSAIFASLRFRNVCLIERGGPFEKAALLEEAIKSNLEALGYSN